MRAYLECSANQSKNYTLSTFPLPAIDETLRIPEWCWPFLYLNFTRILQFSSKAQVITAVCVQIDNCFCNTLIVVH